MSHMIKYYTVFKLVNENVYEMRKKYFVANEPNFKANYFRPKVPKNILGILLSNRESMGHKCLIPEALRAGVGLWSHHALAWRTR